LVARLRPGSQGSIQGKGANRERKVCRRFGGVEAGNWRRCKIAKETQESIQVASKRNQK
jgi:hypothetical protein